jgi:cytochrome P450 family 49 subfamily A
MGFQTQVVFQHYVISNLEHYFPQPNQFLPERWLKICNEHKQAQNHHPFASLPFGYGRRMCLGRRFADLEIQTVIAKVGHHVIF